MHPTQLRGGETVGVSLFGLAVISRGPSASEVPPIEVTRREMRAMEMYKELKLTTADS